MINFCESKEAQLELLSDSVEEMISMRSEKSTQFIIVISFNPLEPEIPYETGIYPEDVLRFLLNEN
jgi:hypothetical protein